MFKMTVVHLHITAQMFSPLMNSAVDDHLLHTGPCSNQTCAVYE